MHRGEYPEAWEEIALRVKERAGWRCVRCGHPDDPELRARHGVMGGYVPCDDACTHPDDGKRRILTVHHLDHDKGNVRWWNLAALCQVCHLTIQGKVHMEQTYSEPHSEWFLHYVAGYYAETSMDRPVSRAFVEDHLVGCLAMGQPHLLEHYRERLTAAS